MFKLANTLQMTTCDLEQRANANTMLAVIKTTFKQYFAFIKDTDSWYDNYNRRGRVTALADPVGTRGSDRMGCTLVRRVCVALT